MSEQEHSSPLTFPCDFPVKVMGKTSDDFRANMLAIFQQHFPDIKDSDMTERPSGKNNYVALSATVHATSQEQLDNLYLALNASPEVLMSL